MNELFGVSMDLIMYVLVVLLAVSLASVTFVALTNRVMFRLGVRNIPRRRAQTTLIVLGLMLSTVIISAAFTTGDTVDRSITSQVYGVLGSLDEQIVVGQRDDEDVFGDDPSEGAVREDTFAAAAVDSLIRELSQNPLVDAVVPVYGDVAVAVNPEKRLSAPLFNVVGLEPQAAADLPDIRVAGGGRAQVSGLAANEIYINESAAEELDAQAGDTISLFTRANSRDFVVKAVVKDARLAGSVGISTRREGGVLPLTTAQQFFGATGQLTMVAISNRGDARSGVRHSDEVRLAALAALPAIGPDKALTVQAVKQISVDLAEEFGNIFTTFFLALGLFSIGAGVLLIFMIFVMLAAERKSEMGMARAVGTRRRDLVQAFLSEGMAYNVLAAAVGTGIGVLVAIGMSQIMAALFASTNLDISPHVTPRSLIISYSLGVVLTFLTVTFSSWRISLINIVRAIRDIPEPNAQRPNWRTSGFLPTLRKLIFRPGRGWRMWLTRIGLAVVGFMVVSSAGAVGSTGGQAALSTLGGLILLTFVFTTFQLGPLFLLVGCFVLAIFEAESSESAFLLLFGLSLAPLGLAFTLRSFGLHERATYTLLGVYLIYIWEFDPWDFVIGGVDVGAGIIERIFGRTEGNIEMFFLSGVMVTLSSTFLVVYNADLILTPITRMGRFLGALLPSVKMAVAYPLNSKVRTGMTMAMFCLVVFALVVMSSMNHNFNRLFLSDRALGGFDISVDENPSSPIGDLKARLQQANAPVLAQIEAVGTLQIKQDRNVRVCQLRPDKPCDPRGALDGGDSDFVEYQVRAVDQDFIDANGILLQARAAGYDSDRAVWQALSGSSKFAVVDSNALAGGGFGTSTFVSGIDGLDTVFEPVTITVVNPETRQSEQVTLIGIIESGSTSTYFGLHVSQQTFASVFGAPDTTRYLVKTAPGTNNIAAAREIEGTLLTTGAQAESLRKVLDDQGELSRGFFYLIQGFMGLGLFVGVAAVGVIAFRTVVERRQQIGMLRAIGYTRRMVGLTFMIESAFIAFMGVLSGVVFALILARQLITEQFANQGVNTFSIPWSQVLLISGLAFGFALLMTLIPSRQAARIPIAQALRYE